MREVVKPRVHEDQELVRNAARNLRAILPPSIRGQRILALNEPFRNPHGLVFTLQLSYNETDVTIDTVRVLTADATGVSPPAHNYVLDYADGKFFPRPSGHHSSLSPSRAVWNSGLFERTKTNTPPRQGIT